MGWIAVGSKAEHEGATTIDIRPGVADFTADIRKLPFDDCSTDGIECHHVLEHLERDDALGALKELYRVLRPGGTLEISTPDMIKCGKALAAGYKAILVNIYSPDPAPEQHHRWGYTPETLALILEKAGFINIQQMHDDDCHSIRYSCRRPE